MKAFLELVRKELRDVRALGLVAWAVASAGLFALCELFPGAFAASELHAAILVVATSLFGGAVASDLLSADAATGRLHTLYTFPLRPRFVWLARVAFLVLAVGLFFGALLASDALAHRMSADPQRWARQTELLEELGRWSALAPAGLTLVAATLFASSIGLRGLAAAASGAMLGLAPIALLVWAGLSVDVRLEPADLPAWTSGLALAFLAASAVAFCAGRPHLALAPRPALLGFGVLLLLGLPVAVVGRSEWLAWRALEPSNPLVAPQWMRVAPDGSRLAFGVVHQRARELNGVWVHDRIEDAWTHVPGEHWALGGFTADGELWVHDQRWRVEDPAFARCVIEPRTGEVLRRLDADEAAGIGVERWELTEVTPLGWDAELGLGTWSIEAPDAAPPVVVEGASSCRGQLPPGTALYVDARGALHWVDAGQGVDRVIREGMSNKPWTRSVDREGRFVVTIGVEGYDARSLATGEVRVGPWDQVYPQWVRRGGHEDFLVLYPDRGADDPLRLVDVLEARERPLLLSEDQSPPHHLEVLADGAVIGLAHSVDDGRWTWEILAWSPDPDEPARVLLAGPR